MVEFNFYLSDENADRLFTIKKLQGYNDMTGNDFAKMLLERELERLRIEREGSNENF